MRRWKCTLITMFFISTFVLAWWGEAGALAFSFQINRFQVNQGGVDLLNDGFDDGLEPPSVPNGSGTYFTTGPFGALDESGSSLTLNNIGAPNVNSFGSVSGMNVPIEIKGVTLGGAGGVIPKLGGAFFVEGDFAGILPADTGPIFGFRENYQISIRDFGFTIPLGTGTDDDFAILRVVNVGGAPRIEFIDIDTNNPSNNMFLGSLSPGSLSSELTLRMDVDAAGNVTASFDPDGPSGVSGFTAISGSTTIYNGENFAFAQFSGSSPVPEPSSLLLLGSGLAGLGFFRMRRKAA